MQDVQGGISRLVDYFGHTDWIDEIDRDILNMESASDCTLGQLFGNYYTGLDKLGIAYGSDEAFNLGFSPYSKAGPNADNYELTNDWREALMNYRDGQNTIGPVVDPSKTLVTVNAEIELTDAQIAKLYRAGKNEGFTVDGMIRVVLENAIANMD